MNKEWSLEKLYKGYDDPKFAADEAELDQLIKDIAALCEDLSGEPKDVLKKAIELNQSLEAKAHTLFSFAGLSQAVNTSDAKAAAVQGRLSRKLSATAAPKTAFVQYVAKRDQPVRDFRILRLERSAELSDFHCSGGI